MASIGDFKAVALAALDTHVSKDQEDAIEDTSAKRMEQRAAKAIQAELVKKYGGNWNVILGKKLSVAANVGQQEGFAAFNIKGYSVFVFQYNTK